MVIARAGLVLWLALALTSCSAATPVPALPPATTAPAVGVAAAAPVAAPVRVSVPSIGAESDLIRTGLNDDRTIEVPPVEDPGQASYYGLAPNPGATGRAVVLGHVNGYGTPGVFARLHELAAGAVVDIERADGTTAQFRITRVETHDKDAFPTAEVYGPTQGREIVLITCGGDLNRAEHSYESNVLAFGELV